MTVATPWEAPDRDSGQVASFLTGYTGATETCIEHGRELMQTMVAVIKEDENAAQQVIYTYPDDWAGIETMKDLADRAMAIVRRFLPLGK